MKFPPLKFENYERRAKYFVYKTEHGGVHIKFKMKNFMDSRVPKLSGGILGEQYVLDNLHFHCYSDHMIYGKSYPVEAHFVHYRRSLGSMRIAKSSKISDAIAVVSIMYEVYNTMSPKIALFEAIQKCHSNCCLPTEAQFRLRDILPSYLRSYYIYRNFDNMNKIWIVMTVPGILSYWQYSQLINLLGSTNNPTQELATKYASYIINGCVLNPVKPNTSPTCTKVKKKSTIYTQSQPSNYNTWYYGAQMYPMVQPLPNNNIEDNKIENFDDNNGTS
ncbi:unnamed protein product [Phyllotreta striolata]|uniref:carbonic anhydrase n=1 Tax=Phyllotreta striolata TaxID=444603 RepID=A0A9N9TSM7_PHYSR|nr:unnamed protein product [Phyllotreta striolata]